MRAALRRTGRVVFAGLVLCAVLALYLFVLTRGRPL
jgi:hypothetical protein